MGAKSTIAKKFGSVFPLLIITSIGPAVRSVTLPDDVYSLEEGRASPPCLTQHGSIRPGDSLQVPGCRLLRCVADAHEAEPVLKEETCLPNVFLLPESCSAGPSNGADYPACCPAILCSTSYLPPFVAEGLNVTQEILINDTESGLDGRSEAFERGSLGLFSAAELPEGSEEVEVGATFEEVDRCGDDLGAEFSAYPVLNKETRSKTEVNKQIQVASDTDSRKKIIDRNVNLPLMAGEKEEENAIIGNGGRKEEKDEDGLESETSKKLNRKKRESSKSKRGRPVFILPRRKMRAYIKDKLALNSTEAPESAALVAAGFNRTTEDFTQTQNNEVEDAPESATTSSMLTGMRSKVITKTVEKVSFGDSKRNKYFGQVLSDTVQKKVRKLPGESAISNVRRNTQFKNTGRNKPAKVCTKRKKDSSLASSISSPSSSVVLQKILSKAINLTTIPAKALKQGNLEINRLTPEESTISSLETKDEANVEVKKSEVSNQTTLVEPGNEEALKDQKKPSKPSFIQKLRDQRGKELQTYRLLRRKRPNVNKSERKTTEGSKKENEHEDKKKGIKILHMILKNENDVEVIKADENHDAETIISPGEDKILRDKEPDSLSPSSSTSLFSPSELSGISASSSLSPDKQNLTNDDLLAILTYESLKEDISKDGVNSTLVKAPFATREDKESRNREESEEIKTDTKTFINIEKPTAHVKIKLPEKGMNKQEVITSFRGSQEPKRKEKIVLLPTTPTAALKSITVITSKTQKKPAEPIQKPPPRKPTSFQNINTPVALPRPQTNDRLEKAPPTSKKKPTPTNPPKVTHFQPLKPPMSVVPTARHPPTLLPLAPPPPPSPPHLPPLPSPSIHHHRPPPPSLPITPRHPTQPSPPIPPPPPPPPPPHLPHLPPTPRPHGIVPPSQSAPEYMMEEEVEDEDYSYTPSFEPINFDYPYPDMKAFEDEILRKQSTKNVAEKLALQPADPMEVDVDTITFHRSRTVVQSSNTKQRTNSFKNFPM